MLRRRLAAFCVFVTASLAGRFSWSRSPSAVPEGADEQAAKPVSGDVGLDRVATEPPPAIAAAQMTATAALAQQLFAHAQWSEASLPLYRVATGETGDPPGYRQLAQYCLAICLYRTGFYQASYQVFATIADDTRHVMFRSTLFWFAQLDQALPEAADVAEQVGKYRESELERFNDGAQRDLYWRLTYLLGRYRFRNGRYQDASRLFAQVGSGSPYYVKAQFFAGTSHAQLGKSVPAVRHFQNVWPALQRSNESTEEKARLRDLARLSTARTYYSTLRVLDRELGAPAMDPRKLSAAVRYYELIQPSSPYWLDALLEASWAFFMAGDYSHALGNITTLEAPYYSSAFFPEAEILKAIIYFANCDYEKATIAVARFHQRSLPLRRKLQQLMTHLRGADPDQVSFDFVGRVRSGRAILDEELGPLVEAALDERPVVRSLQYVHFVESELGRLGSSTATFRDSALGHHLRSELLKARTLAVRKAGALARQRCQRLLDELDGQLRNGRMLLIDIAAARRSARAVGLVQKDRRRAEEAAAAQIRRDDAFVLWPFTGEYWRDELGTYRAIVPSLCPR